MIKTRLFSVKIGWALHLMNNYCNKNNPEKNGVETVFSIIRHPAVSDQKVKDLESNG